MVPLKVHSFFSWEDTPKNVVESHADSTVSLFVIIEFSRNTQNWAMLAFSDCFKLWKLDEQLSISSILIQSIMTLSDKCKGALKFIPLVITSNFSLEVVQKCQLCVIRENAITIDTKTKDKVCW